MSDGTERSVSVLGVLREGIEALERVDAAHLEGLATRAGKAVMREGEQRAAREQYAVLGLLLSLTRRNLRLLRGERREAYGRD
ncbi:MAG: hypothetical protein WB622_10925 [Acidobacteriaceae bacterium]|jgi:hypothetical protein